MNNEYLLSDLKVGQSCSVEWIDPSNNLSKRLNELGFSKNSRLMCVGVSPLGDLRAYLLHGAVIALRIGDCADIKIRRLE